MMLRREWNLFVGALLCITLLAGCETAGIKKVLPGETTTSLSMNQLPPPKPRQWPDAELDVYNYRSNGWGLVAMPAMQAYLNRLYAAVKKEAGQPDWPGSIYILADTSLRATSTAAGNVYISLGWLKTFQSEDEVAALLAHEFAHVYLNHHEIHDVGQAAETAAGLAMLTVKLSEKVSGLTNLNATQSLQVLHAVGEGVVMPAWQRSIEESADTLGAALTLRQGYSYTQGFKAFLEHVDAYDNEQKEGMLTVQLQNEELQRLAITNATAAEVQRQKQSGQDITGLGQAAALVQGNLNQASFDIFNALGKSLKDLGGRLSETHGEAATREEVLSKAVAPLLEGKPRPTVKKESWHAVRSEPQVAEVLRSYERLPLIEAALNKKDMREAVTLARAATAGAASKHALPLYYLHTAQNQNNLLQGILELNAQHLKGIPLPTSFRPAQQG